MMSLLLSSVSASAILGEAPALTGIFIDPAYLHTSFVLSSDKLTLSKNTTSSTYQYVVSNIIIPKDGKIRYWECKCGPDGPNTYSSFYGLSSKTQLLSSNGPTSGSIMSFNNSFSIRGNGGIWLNSGATNESGVITFGKNKTVMFAFDAKKGKLWYGVDGIWKRNPRYSLPLLHYADSSGLALDDYYIALGAAISGESVTLRTKESSFEYPIPFNCVPLDEDSYVPITFPLQVYLATGEVALGNVPNTLSTVSGKAHAVIGNKKDTVLVKKSTINAIIVGT